MKTFIPLLVAVFVGGSLAGNYNYGEVVSKSILFYEAQRAGALPSSNRVKWRRSSMTNDKDGSVDLNGGYFDAGDYVKFNFPQAWSLTTLAFGAIEFPNGYSKAGETTNLYWSLKWGLDYLIKCHPSANVLYVQVGDGNADHASWDLPERWSGARPTYKLTTSAPGSDVAGETAAAMAAGSILLKSWNAAYSNTLLSHAKTIYNFAKTYKGKYSDSVKAATPFYTSWAYEDELAWAAAWLYRATNDKAYLTDAENFYNQGGLSTQTGFNWDAKVSGVDVLLAKLTGKQQYKNKLTSFCDNAINTAKSGRNGLLLDTDWGSLRSASNTVFICLQAAKLGLNKANYNAFAKKEIDLMLGDYGRSFVVGFGNNPPVNPHHRAASCPNPPTACGWNWFNSNAKNTNQLTGALVGGPSKDGNYEDKRNDAVRNEVALDYNAAFQGDVAALKEVFG